MQLLRADVIVTSLQNQPGCVVLDERTGKEYEFGEVEHFLLDRFRVPFDLDQLRGELNAHFALNYSAEDLKGFIDLLSSWGLLDDADQPEPPAKNEEDAIPDSGSGAATFGEDLRRPNRWHFFNPERLLDRLGELSVAIRILVWITPLALAIGICTVMFNLSAFIDSFALAAKHFGTIGRLLLAACTVNLASQLARGVVARRHGLSTPSFGLVLLFGLVPRFNIQIRNMAAMERFDRLWFSATSTIVRLWIFSLAAILWAVTHSTGTLLPLLAVEFALISLFGLIFVANPLWRGDGANFVSAWLGIPNIHQRSRRALLGLVMGEPSAVTRHSRHRLILGIIGLASLALFCSFAGFIIYQGFHYLESRYRGAGVFVFLLLGAYVSLSIYRQASARKERARTRIGATAMPRLKNVEPQAARSGPGLSRRNGRRLSSRERKLAFIAAVLALFLPYSPEVGGNAEIFPRARVTLSVDAEGILDQVFFNGGERVAAGTVIAQTADYKQFNQLRILEAEIEAKRNDIQRYQTTPSYEQIRLAEEKITTARQQAKYSEDKLAKQTALFGQNFISIQSLEDSRNAALRDKQALLETIASLESLKAQVNQYQIESLKADLDKLKREADYEREKMQRTRLVTPIAGQIVTPDLQYLRNSFLKPGQKFADIEDNEIVILHIDVLESDLKGVSLGAPITLRLLAYPDREFTGVVEEITPAATVVEFGRVVRVKGRLANPEGYLKTGLTGYAKIRASDTIVLLAFTRSLIRFVKVEVWSWLP